ncbi:alpha-glucosidase [Rhodobacter sp. TJ_12]|uniref:alpha-glucosidase n=1 Tax=Rhodobacter sp. TJ_12 TaxID=2029399 RepID=UPI001CC1418B|nr:alpha-glucosidase [Rhodobacter sp. TJ_12]MBZ4022437.1 alpha-glucosidase [Rhodobacter sp. TJ_12]
MNLLNKSADWWRGAVIYQIYPRSFQDTNGDGVGDLLGIVQRLPHVASLGADAVWISPFFTSPMKDFGYDISDYCDVDPMFGSMADFDQVIATAHALGLKVLIDLVLSHTSDVHPWFKESRDSRDNPKADWYVWADPKPDGTPPNNWLSIFGGPAWQWDSRREQYYLHNFLIAQPDLNFHSTEVQQELLAVAKFWLDRGVDGFRLDTINFYMHDEELRDNPALAAAERNDQTAPKVNPYNHQRHIYDKNHPRNVEFLRKLRTLMNAYNAAAVGEIGDSQRGLEILGEYTSGEDKVQMSYAFELLSGHEPLNASFIKDTFERLERVAADGWACWAYSNHDVVRHISRWGLNPASAKLYTTLLMCLKGSVCLYQGEELGLPEAEIGFEDVRDPYGIQFWPEFKGRDGCRTPMVWSKDAVNAGFSTAKPWLPVPSSHYSHAPDATENDPAALIHHYRRAIAFRHHQEPLRTGDMTHIWAHGDVLSFHRTSDEGEILCFFNLSDHPVDTTVPAGDWVTIGGELGSIRPMPDHTLHLGPWQPSLLKLNQGGRDG